MANLQLDEKLLADLSPQEREVAIKMLKEISAGKSDTFEQLKYADYEEIPVDIETFVDNNKYLGNAWHDNEGKSKLYPYWRRELHKIFPNNLDTAFNNAIFSGSRGRGKSEIAVLVASYLLYRVLCLKDPIGFFRLKPTEKIVFAFMNIKLALAEEIGISKFQNTLQSSPWFLAHGELEGRTKKIWVPRKYNGQEVIDIKIGSQADDLIGLPIYFCLDGDTLIKTAYGDIAIKDLENKEIRVVNLSNEGKEIISDPCTVKMTGAYREEYQLELEDGTIIKCTPNHKFMLKDGSYKEAQYLTEEDELADIEDDKNTNTNSGVFPTYNEFINSIINTRGQWNIPEGEYFEAHHILPICMGGEGPKNRRTHHPNIIYLYAREHYMAHKLLALENPGNASLIWAWDAMAYKEIAGRKYEVSAEDYETLKKLHAEYMSKNKVGVNKLTGKSYLYGTTLSNETKQKISRANKGKNTTPKSEETKQKMRAAALARECNGAYKYVKGKKAINNGTEQIYIDKDSPLPEGYVYGLLNDNRSSENYVKSWTDERKSTFSCYMQGPNNPHYGIHINYGTGMTGKKHTKESKLKHSLTVQNKTPEEKKKIAEKLSNVLTGRKKSDSFKDKCSKNTSKYIYIINNDQIYGYRKLIEYLALNYNIKASEYLIKKYFNNISDSLGLGSLGLRRIINENCKNKQSNA